MTQHFAPPLFAGVLLLSSGHLWAGGSNCATTSGSLAVFTGEVSE